MILRKYQVTGICEARRHIAAGKRSPLLVLPTGGGKTCMAAHIATNHIGKGGKVAWLTHRRELVKQAVATLEAFGLSVGHSGLRPDAPVQVTSVQTVLARGEAPAGTLAVLDEAHHFVADEWKRLPEIYNGSIIVGLTATPERKDGQGLGAIFDCMVVVAQIRDLIAINSSYPGEGLTPCEVVWPGKTLEAKVLAQFPVDAYVKDANGTSAVVFAPHIKAAKDYCKQFVDRGISARVVSHRMSDDERDDALHRFKIGDVKVLCNVYVLTEGWDAPRAKTCILARTIGSAGAYLQMVGRVLRPWDGQRAKLIDLHGSSIETYGPPDEERFYSLEGRAIRRKDDGESFCRIHGTPLINGGCAQCAADGVTTEQVTWRARGTELVKFAHMRELPANKRVVCLVRWLTETRAKGHKDGNAFYKYRAVFGHWPPAPVKAQAVAYIEGR